MHRFITDLEQWQTIRIENMQVTGQAMAKRDDRLVIAPLGEPYEDLLAIDAFLAGNSVPQQGKSSLSAYLKQKKPYIEEGVRYLARKRQVSFEEMWDLILTGEVEKLSPEEYRELLKEKEKAGNRD